MDVVLSQLSSPPILICAEKQEQKYVNRSTEDGGVMIVKGIVYSGFGDGGTSKGGRKYSSN